ncbi:MAG: hypothetical protein P0S93_03605 [Candidatus Neptunochlamydia sp.]|nr:hypothetical protein [Candidatus Neptunochlamydia sp.]
MKDDTKRIKRTNQALKGLFFEGSPIGEIADIMDVAKNQFDGVMRQIKLIMVELFTASRFTISLRDKHRFSEEVF